MDEYAAAWKTVMDYLTENGYENRPGVPFELYPNTEQDMKGGPNDSWSVDICLPVK